MVFFKYLFTGAFNTIFGYSIYAFLIFFELDKFFALFLAYFFGIFFNYFSYSKFTFDKEGKYIFFKFLIAYISIFILNLFILDFISNLILNDYMSQLFTLPIVVLVSFFILNKLVFR